MNQAHSKSIKHKYKDNTNQATASQDKSNINQNQATSIEHK